MPTQGHTDFFNKALGWGTDLLSKAANNYSKKYEKKLENLLESLRQPGNVNTPFIQGINPGIPYDQNVPGTPNPYGQISPYGTAPGYGYPTEPNQGYPEGNQPGGSYGQGSGYPPNPNFGGYPSGNPNAYSQGQAYADPYNQNPGYPQGGLYGQAPEGYPYPNSPGYGGISSADPNAFPQDHGYGNPSFSSPGYPQQGTYGQAQGLDPSSGVYSQGQPYNDPYNLNQGYPEYPQTTPSGETYGQGQSGYPQYDPNAGNLGYAGSPYPEPGIQNLYPGGGGYGESTNQPAQPGVHDPYQPQPAQQPQYGETSQPQNPSEPMSQAANHPPGPQGHTLQLDVALIKRTMVNGTETLLPIQDGDVLRDGRGKADAGDKFRIMFRANRDCYVYVIAIDGSAWAQGVFPALTSPFANPVKQGQQYVIPENNNWFSLDQYKGIETVFFVASPAKRPDIEEILTSIAGKERHPKAKPQQVIEAPIIPAGFSRSQQSSTPFILGQGLSGNPEQIQGLLPTTYFTQKAGEALRVTRWFRHD